MKLTKEQLEAIAAWAEVLRKNNDKMQEELEREEAENNE